MNYGLDGGKGTQPTTEFSAMAIVVQQRQAVGSGSPSQHTKNEDKRKEMDQDSGTSVQIRVATLKHQTLVQPIHVFGTTSPELEPNRLDSNRIQDGRRRGDLVAKTHSRGSGWTGESSRGLIKLVKLAIAVSHNH